MHRLTAVLCLYAAAAAGAETAPPAKEWVAPESWLVYTVIAVVFVACLATILLVRGALTGSKWSLSDALSEDVSVTAYEKINGVNRPILDGSNKPLEVIELRASISRVIALMGMIAMLLMFVGFGVFVLFGFAMTGTLPDSIDEIVKFLAAGLTLFAPYAVNKFSKLFEGLSAKR